MAYVTVPQDLGAVKNKVVLNLTKRQLICFGIGAAIGVPLYFITRRWIGNTNAATIMVFAMLPAFLFAMYEKDSMHLEQILMNVIRVKFIRPSIRRFETTTMYDSEEAALWKEQSRKPEGGNVGMVKKEKPGKKAG